MEKIISLLYVTLAGFRILFLSKISLEISGFFNLYFFMSVYEDTFYENHNFEIAITVIISWNWEERQNIIPLINIFKDIHVGWIYKSIIGNELMLDLVGNLMCNLQDYDKQKLIA